MINVELFPATLKRCFPLLKQRAPTKLRGEICGFSGSHADSQAQMLLDLPRVSTYLLGVSTFVATHFAAACILRFEVHRDSFRRLIIAGGEKCWY
jgi:hypothetical protein